MNCCSLKKQKNRLWLQTTKLWKLHKIHCRVGNCEGWHTEISLFGWMELTSFHKKCPIWKNWGSWDFQIKIGTVSKINRESTKKRGQDDGQWLVNDWPTPTPHTLGGWQSQRPTLTQPVTTPTTLYIKKPVRIFLVMLKIFFRNTLWRKYNSWRYSLHLILWLQKVSFKTKYTSENMNKVRTLSIDYEWMIKEKHEFQMFFATIMLLFSFFFQNRVLWTFSHCHKENKLSPV